MRLTHSFSELDVCRPLPATVLLEHFKGEEFDSAISGLRHPSGLYAVSMRAVTDAFDDAFLAASELRRASSADERQRTGRLLSKAIDQLLDATTEHFDDAKSIVFLFDAKFGDRLGKKTLAHFTDLIRPARAFAATQANEIKHRQGRVRLIRATSAQVEVNGYFIEGVDDGGSVAPNSRVHDGATAYSLGRAFRTLACSVYFTSRAICSVLEKARVSGSLNEQGLGTMRSVFQTLASLDRYVFWDETTICPDIVQRTSSLTIDAPARVSLLAPPEGSRIQLVIPGDGSTSTYRLPYFGNYQARAPKPRRF